MNCNYTVSDLEKRSDFAKLRQMSTE